MTHPPHPEPVITESGDIIASRAPARERWSWALYDFSNTIFSMNIASLFFAVWLVDDIGASNTMAALATSVSSVLVVLSIPLFGAISDATQRRKPWVVGFSLISVTMVIVMGIVGQTMIPLFGEAVKNPTVTSYTLAGLPAFAILGSFVLANWAYQGAMPFYNAMMFELAPPKDNRKPQEVTYHGVEAVYDNIVLAANEGRSYVDAVDVKEGKHLDRLTADVSKPCCIERIPGTDPVRVLVSNIGDGSVQLVEVSKEGKLKSLGKVDVGKAPKRVAFVPASR